jgi:purine nucleoside permease
MIARIVGIAGINPYQGTLGTAAFARFAVQVALQYELDARQMPSNWTTGYWALVGSFFAPP